MFQCNNANMDEGSKLNVNLTGVDFEFEGAAQARSPQ